MTTTATTAPIVADELVDDESVEVGAGSRTSPNAGVDDDWSTVVEVVTVVEEVTVLLAAGVDASEMLP